MFNHLRKMCLLVLLVSPFSHAHDFWLEPETFQVTAPSKVQIDFQVGHKDDVGPWDLRWKRIVGLRQYQQDGISDLSASVEPISSRQRGSAQATLASEGTVVVGFESHHSISELNAERFNNYAEKEGLKLVLANRLTTNSVDKPGREIYSRRAKAIIQSGKALTNNVLQPIGHTLEIVPLTHPYKPSDSDDLSIKLMFKGKPLANAKVRLVSLDNEQIADVSVTTNTQGVAQFLVPKSGKWMFASVWGVPLSDDSRAEFESYFSSMTIGF